MSQRDLGEPEWLRCPDTNTSVLVCHPAAIRRSSIRQPWTPSSGQHGHGQRGGAVAIAVRRDVLWECCRAGEKTVMCGARKYGAAAGTNRPGSAYPRDQPSLFFALLPVSALRRLSTAHNMGVATVGFRRACGRPTVAVVKRCDAYEPQKRPCRRLRACRPFATAPAGPRPLASNHASSSLGADGGRELLFEWCMCLPSCRADVCRLPARGPRWTRDRAT